MGWTLDDLVRKAAGGVSRSTIIRIEKEVSGSHPASVTNAEALARAFGISPEDLNAETSKIIVADGDFRPIRIEHFSTHWSDGKLRLQHERENPRPDHVYVAMFESSPDTLIVRASDD